MKRLLRSLLVLTTVLPGLAYAQTGSVDLKIHVANPSQKEPQTVPVKVYLPKEATPKDVKDLGDLKLDYDPETGAYYVHGDVVVEAGQSITKTGHMQDIWGFSEDQLVSFVGRAKERAGKLTQPAAAPEATGIVPRGEQKGEAIFKRPKEADGQPPERVQAYRQGLAVITTIEQDLDALDKLKQVPFGREGENLSREPDSRMALLAGSGDSPEGGAPPRRALSMTPARALLFGHLWRLR